jgi:hypothetical protein
MEEIRQKDAPPVPMYPRHSAQGIGLVGYPPSNSRSALIPGSYVLRPERHAHRLLLPPTRSDPIQFSNDLSRGSETCQAILRTPDGDQERRCFDPIAEMSRLDLYRQAVG